jgi:hypothetical protein
MRQMIGLSALANCPSAILTKIMSPVSQQLWTGNWSERA